MKKCAIMLAAATVAASCLAVVEEVKANGNVYSDSGENLVAFAMAELEKADAERALEAQIVGGVYGEGSNSSFIVRKELTATQKRFLALGRNFLMLTAYAKELEGRIAAMEARFKEMDDQAEKRRKARESLAEDRKRRDALRRAQERGKRVRGAAK